MYCLDLYNSTRLDKTHRKGYCMHKCKLTTLYTFNVRAFLLLHEMQSIQIAITKRKLNQKVFNTIPIPILYLCYIEQTCYTVRKDILI